jgi:two-component system sensor histidine kinase/response regulator
MKKILVIEDDLMVRTVIMDILEAEDFQVFGAENGRLGWEMAREILPNLIICDVMMPEMAGYEVSFYFFDGEVN